jgi:type VI secretion system protein VasD
MNTLRSTVVQPGPAEAAPQRRSLLGLIATVAGAGWLAGCGMFSKPPPAPPPPPPPPAAPPPRPGTLSIHVIAASGINPDARSRPSPVVVRLYELKASAPFESADFLSLYDKDLAVLGADIVVRDEFVLRPGESKAINKALAADTKFIGVVAAFRELERARWRALVAVLPNKSNLVTISLDGIAVQTTVTAT